MDKPIDSKPVDPKAIDPKASAAGSSSSSPLPVVQSGAPSNLWPMVGAGFVVLAIATLLLAIQLGGEWAGAAEDFSIKFVSVVLEALPFVMIGALIGGLIEVFVSRDRLTALLPKAAFPAILIAGLLGLVFPVCECAVIAVTRRLVRKGVPFAVAVAYLLAGPIFNPIVAASTWVAFQKGPYLSWFFGAEAIPAMPFYRLGTAYVIAVIVAYLMSLRFPHQTALLPSVARAAEGSAMPRSDAACDHDHGRGDAKPRVPIGQRLLHAFGHAADDFVNIAQYLVLGAFVAGLCNTFIPRSALEQLASTPAAASGVMMSMAVALNVCSEADAFVAAAFQNIMPASALLGFMVLGPMVDLKLIAMYLSFVRRGALFTMVALIVVAVFAMTMLVDPLLGGPR